jgi:hypothetical protein
VVSPYLQFRLWDLQKLSNMSNSSIRLGPRQYMLLYHFAENPATSAYDISPVRQDKKNEKDYRDTKDRIKRLNDLQFVEATKKPNVHRARYLKLSDRGIYYLIANNSSLPHGILKSLLENYGDHLLFHYFLIPYIKRETLLKISDSAIFSHTFSYLHDCCKTVQETLYMISHTYNQKNGNLTRQLFSWDNIHNSDQDKEVLRYFLKQRFKWNWLDKAEIRKTEDGNSTSVSYGLNSLLISLNKEKTKATLSLRGKKQLEFIVRESKVWTFEVPIISLEEIHMRILQTSIRTRVQQLIFSLLSSYDPEHGSISAAIRILSQDKRFMVALRDTKDQFDKRYNLLKPRKKI